MRRSKVEELPDDVSAEEMLRRQIRELRQDVEDCRASGSYQALAKMSADLRKLEHQLHEARSQAARDTSPDVEEVADDDLVAMVAADLAAMPPGLLDAVLSELVKRSGAAVLSRPSLRLRVVEGGRG